MTSRQGEALAWLPALSVGVPALDDDHRVLIDLIEQIVAEPFKDSAAVIGTLLATLVDWTGFHFAREERMMEAIRFPDYRDHKRAHDLLTDQLVWTVERYGEDPMAVDIGGLRAFLRTWLHDHLTGADMAYRALADGDPRAGAAAASIGLDYFAGADEGAVV